MIAPPVFNRNRHRGKNDRERVGTPVGAPWAGHGDREIGHGCSLKSTVLAVGAPCIKIEPLPARPNAMPNFAAPEALLNACRSEMDWLTTRAKAVEAESPLLAADYIHRARNLQTIINGYERLSAKDPNRPHAQGGNTAQVQKSPSQAIR
jgi:hypothetical protein